jgi:hypothetical protein
MRMANDISSPRLRRSLREPAQISFTERAGWRLALDLAERSSGGLGEHKQQATSNIQHRDTNKNNFNTRPGGLQ